jgi:4-hydroxybenzoate polyprenyltransferase
MEFFQLIKLKHWIKNILIIIPIITSHQFSLLKEINTYYVILIFCLISSVVYYINNFFDYGHDTKNKLKKITYTFESNFKNKCYFFIILITFLLTQLAVLNLDFKLLIIINIYFSFNILYTYLIKKIKYLDILFLGSFHVLRIVFGSVAFNINQSIFFILFYLSLFISIGINKRIIEHKNIGNGHRPYDKRDITNLKMILYGFLTLVSSVFLIYIQSEVASDLYNSIYLLYCNWIILNLILINFIYKTTTNNIYDIVDFIVKDKINIILGLIFFYLFLKNSI